jgi:tRNA-dependent cyclodipeptide synthase
MALGYPENRARRDKAIPQGNILKNRVKRAMADLGYSDEQVKIVDWETEVGNSAEYKIEYNKIINSYDSNPQFRNATNEATRNVLKDEERVSDLDSATKIAVKYLLSEFAFMEFAPKLFGVDRVTYIYHKNWPVYEAYRSGEFDGKNREYLGSETIPTGK